jgi:hypothetical protein
MEVLYQLSLKVETPVLAGLSQDQREQVVKAMAKLLRQAIRPESPAPAKEERHGTARD